MTRTMTTAAATTIAVLLGTGTPAASTARLQAQTPDRPQREQSRTGDGRSAEQSTMTEILLRGCVARDDGWYPQGDAGTSPPDAPGAATPATKGRGQMFVLRNASRMGADGSRAGGRSGDDDVYRLVPRSGVGLSTYEGQEVEVRGRLDDGSNTAAAAYAQPSPRDSQAVQGGQMQNVGQTMQSGQGGQSGQSTTTRETARPVDGGAGQTLDGLAGPTPDGHATVLVTSVRVLAATCPQVP
jgi:hypothetical protein